MDLVLAVHRVARRVLNHKQEHSVTLTRVAGSQCYVLMANYPGRSGSQSGVILDCYILNKSQSVSTRGEAKAKLGIPWTVGEKSTNHGSPTISRD